ncbi:SIS domain-containing protein [Paenarthrobacter aurescens]|nr:SIS domain-containing protein [Paenarthrobacter aurescens]UKA50944.1 SIS domain-containing protein [Arthrobacter sp. FW305-123]MDO6142675.1 SIS domain-containing protein [Paenarthrobacter aurescens]MDO6146522.1 SIS domain-containing protein [Paenarthrobacter aurescens]MDO6157767.1 SIS domain-containing protein [Paenarthrobacter aurescens]MDO6161752.1 SIS domain-containing protein [Paenarthrobacter aurescens]
MSIVVRRTGQAMRSTGSKPNRHAVDVVLGHLGEIGPAVAALRRESSRLAEWGEELARVRLRGGSVFAAGSDGSSHEAQRFTSELNAHDPVDGSGFKAISITKGASGADGSTGSMGAQISNQVRRGDIVVLLAAKGITEELRDAAAAAKSKGARVWALTGKESKELAQSVNEAICIDTDPPHAEEAHLVAVLALCECFEDALKHVQPE